MKDAKGINENHEFDNRITNLMWTISGDYDEDMDKGEKSSISENVALYHAVTAGGRRKYIAWPIVEKYVASSSQAGFDKNILLGLITMVSDLIIEEKVIAERPGVYDIRKKAYKDILERYHKLHTDNLLETARHAMILEKTEQNPCIDVTTRNLLNDLSALQTKEDTVELLKGIEELYLKYFSNSVKAVIGEKEDSPGSGTKSDDNSDIMPEEIFDESETLDTEISAEDVINSWNFSNGVLQVKDEDLKKNQEKVAYYYGESFLHTNDLKKLQNRVCQGTHGNCLIHMTDGVIRSDSKNDCQIKYVQRQQANNSEDFQANEKVYKRNINKLRDSMARTLVEEEIADRIPSDTGKIVANKLWRINRSRNNKVFVKTIDNDNGNFVVDILIDSSGSLRTNQSQVAIQAYILARALTVLGIPNRVLGFSSFLDYTVIKRFRDYESPLSANENIFEYFCSGNNRDGLAIKATCEDLLKRRENNKILIVLSDGRPNDFKVEKGRSENLYEAYRGGVAIEDTAKEVRLARQQEILVLGVFTGDEHDLMAEKLIYGKDFAYIKNINRFSEIVIKYLKQIIMN